MDTEKERERESGYDSGDTGKLTIKKQEVKKSGNDRTDSMTVDGKKDGKGAELSWE